MPTGQKLWEVMARYHPDAVSLGNACYLRLSSGFLVRAEFVSRSSSYDGLQLTVLNPRTGPVDSLTIRSWELPRSVEDAGADSAEEMEWDIYQPQLDIAAFSEAAEKYLRLFQECDLK